MPSPRKQKPGIQIGETEAGRPLELPHELVTQTMAILGVRGSGKTNTAVVASEGMLDHNQQVVVIDPLDIWWGLRAAAKGRAKGYPIVVLGGEHADLPLEAGGGKVIADFLVEHAASMILSTRHLSKTAQRQFVTDFAERLYDLKGQSRFRTPMHLAIDEADLFAPQRLFSGMERLFGAIDNLVRRGRASGIGVSLITQRAAVLNKDVLTQCECLVCHRTIGPQDRKAIEAWIEVHDVEGVAKKVLSTLHKLKIGEAWLWSPGWLGLLERVQIRKRRTFDSSATPQIGARIVAPKRLARVDLARLRKEMAATIERARAVDPRALRKRIVDLERELKKRPQAAPAEPSSRAIQAALDRHDREWKTRVSNFVAVLKKELRDLRSGTTHIEGMLPSIVAFSPKRPRQTRLAQEARQARRPDSPATSAGSAKKARPLPAAVALPKKIGGGKQRMLVALAQRPQGLSGRQLGIRAGLFCRSGTFGTYLAELRSNGWIDGDKSLLRITVAGVEAIGSFDPLPTGPDLLAYWLGRLGRGGKARMLRALADAWPQALTKEMLGERADLSHRSGTFGTYLAELRALELASGRDELRLADELME